MANGNPLIRQAEQLGYRISVLDDAQNQGGRLPARRVRAGLTQPTGGHPALAPRHAVAAPTLALDPQLKDGNLRLYLAYLEQALDRATQWVVTQQDGPALWTSVCRTVENFLFNEWQGGHLVGSTAAEAFIARCDRTTMTQSDIDNGRLVCLVGVALVRPAEFTIFRVGQWTASRP